MGRAMSEQLPDLLRPRVRDRPVWVRALCLAGAVVFFAAGIVGWLIPFVTGVPFYVVGFVLLGMASNQARKWINRMERKLPERFRWKLRRGLKKVPGRMLRSFVRLPE